MNDVFGFEAPTPPYRYLGDNKIEIIRENWEEYLIGKPELDDKYIYMKCLANPETNLTFLIE